MKSQKKQFNEIKATSSPSDAFSKRLWERLDAEVPQAFSRKKYRRMSISAGVAAILMALSGTTGAYAYQSPSVTPDSPLYNVRQAVENVEERFQRTPEKRAEFHARMAERRGNEFEQTKDPDKKKMIRHRMIERLELSDEELAEIRENPEGKEIIREKLDALRAEHEEKIREHLQAAFDEAETDEERERITNKLEALDEHRFLPHRVHNGDDPDRPHREHNHEEGDAPHRLNKQIRGIDPEILEQFKIRMQDKILETQIEA